MFLAILHKTFQICKSIEHEEGGEMNFKPIYNLKLCIVNFYEGMQQKKQQKNWNLCSKSKTKVKWNERKAKFQSQMESSSNIFDLLDYPIVLQDFLEKLAWAY